jgi:hypothetical protein
MARSGGYIDTAKASRLDDLAEGAGGEAVEQQLAVVADADR